MLPFLVPLYSLNYHNYSIREHRNSLCKHNIDPKVCRRRRNSRIHPAQTLFLLKPSQQLNNVNTGYLVKCCILLEDIYWTSNLFIKHYKRECVPNLSMSCVWMDFPGQSYKKYYKIVKFSIEVCKSLQKPLPFILSCRHKTFSQK